MNNEQIVFDQKIRYQVYDSIIRAGQIPTTSEIASVVSCSSDEVRASFVRLSDAHILVLQKGNGEILMANPFSAVPTPFLVKSGEFSFYGNCIWDAMGIPAMLKQDGIIETSCGCCGTAMSLEITNGLPRGAAGIAHFAIPAAHWWDDIIFN